MTKRRQRNYWPPSLAFVADYSNLFHFSMPNDDIHNNNYIYCKYLSQKLNTSYYDGIRLEGRVPINMLFIPDNSLLLHAEYFNILNYTTVHHIGTRNNII